MGEAREEGTKKSEDKDAEGDKADNIFPFADKILPFASGHSGSGNSPAAEEVAMKIGHNGGHIGNQGGGDVQAPPAEEVAMKEIGHNGGRSDPPMQARGAFSNFINWFGR